MLILFDNGTPRGLARYLGLVVLEHSQWPMVKLVAENIRAAVDSAQPGSYTEVEVPFKE
jgi:hypothetical protein